ncbi:hypothetical protein SDC9_166746 [bioreactor metagenome]|uniref:Uncharacterized protein n=1 Tax=bioreactor metagenome TaxID=1076179 RepID=A0A645FXW4_9ZZZZ
MRGKALLVPGEAALLQGALQGFIKGVALIQLPSHGEKGRVAILAGEGGKWAQMQGKGPDSSGGLLHGLHGAQQIVTFADKVERNMKIIRRHKAAAPAFLPNRALKAGKLFAKALWKFDGDKQAHGNSLPLSARRL